MRILITGSRGYIGKALVYQLLEKGYKVIGVDNDARAKWVENCGGGWNPNDVEDSRLINISADLTERDVVNELLAIHKPDVIIHLASQPSMPYSQLSGERAYFTQLNNVAMCLNLLWGMKENGLLTTRFITTTTTGIPGQIYDTIPEDDTLNKAGSWYHTSRGFDSANCSLASRQWGIQIVEFRTSIVYGLQTKFMREAGLGSTRYDTDFYFGTALNRFMNQAFNKEPLTIYGKGEQTKPFISLEDTTISLANAVDHKFDKGHTILNQVTEHISIIELAHLIKKATDCEIHHLPNPRKENETHKMLFENKKFLKVLNKPINEIREEIPLMWEELFRAKKDNA